MAEYYQTEQLKKFAQIGEGNQELADKFFEYYNAVFREGSLSGREKALIALAVAHAVQCPYCIDAYSKGCLEHGADLDQMTWHVRSEVVHPWYMASRCSNTFRGLECSRRVSCSRAAEEGAWARAHNRKA